REIDLEVEEVVREGVSTERLSGGRLHLRLLDRDAWPVIAKADLRLHREGELHLRVVAAPAFAFVLRPARAAVAEDGVAVADSTVVATRGVCGGVVAGRGADVADRA